jgi:RNA polymerase sigma-70 factor (ECF subfamily)
LQSDDITTGYLLQLSADDPQFDQVYLEHYAALHRYAYTVLNERALADEMVHEVFLKLLEKQKGVAVHTSLKAYLYRSVHNECMNYLKRSKVKQRYETYTINKIDPHTENPLGKLQYRELELRLREAINELPEQCRTVFQMSRFDELKYAEIAGQLGISIKTVENQIGKALKRLRLQLADYLPLIIWFLLNRML